MKVLYVGEKYDYGKSERGFSYEYFNVYGALTKMNNAANEVICFPVDEMTIKEGREKMNEELLKIVFKEKPKLIFFFNGGKAIKKEVIKEIAQKSGAITFNWFSDDHWKFDKYSKYWAPLYHWIATTDYKSVLKYYEIGYKNVILSQWACNHFLYKPLDLPKIYDVTFVGAAHGNRKKIVQKVKEAGIDIKCWGSGWPTGRVSQEEMLRIFSQSKINLNFTKSSGVLWKELASIFFYRDFNRSIGLNNPKECLDNLKSFFPSMWSKQIKGRVFEIPGCYGFLLTEYANHLEDYYKIGEDIDCFKNIPELIKKIKYYLINDKKRQTIADMGYAKTMKDHTFERRFNKIFKTVGLTP